MSRELLKRSLEALGKCWREDYGDLCLTIDLEEELAKPEPEPVAWLWDNGQIRLWLDSPALPAGVVSDIRPVPVYAGEVK